MRLFSAALVAFALVAVAPREARAELGADVAALTKSWSKQAKVRRLKPRLLERGGLRPLLLSREETDPTTDGCTTVVVISAASTSMLLRFLPTDGPLRWPEGEWPEASVAGAVQLVRCGVRKVMLERLAIDMRSPRAVVEVIVARAPRPLPPLLVTLSHRDPGPSAPVGRSGPRPVSAPLADRARAFDTRARREGAADVTLRSLAAERDGAGEIPVRFEAGCHRVDVLGVPAPEGHPRGVDMDAELLLMPGGELAAQDRTENADASLSFCVGERRLGRLRFGGTLPRSPVVVLSARWEFPAGLPEDWGAGPRARIAEAVRRHHRKGLGKGPLYSSLGVAGFTILPVDVEPGACYLAAVAAIRGEPAGIAIAADAGSQHSQDNPGSAGSGTSIAFCAGSSERASIEVEARGVGIIWLMGLWQTGRLPIGGAHTMPVPGVQAARTRSR